MAFLSTLKHQLHLSSASNTPHHSTEPPLVQRLAEVFLATFDLGFTAFGGPPVHFQIFYRRFVEGISTRGRYNPCGHSSPRQHASGTAPNHVNNRLKWIDHQMYQELFALVQGLPGPASTKLLFTIAGLHSGWAAALFVFLLWSLPGAIGMFALSLGVQQIGDTLPPIIYALLSGLNASTVGIVALAAVQLAEKAIVDNLSRILVVFGACAGLCYNALWYFPVLIVVGGMSALIWDTWLRQQIEKVRLRRKRRSDEAAAQTDPEHREGGSVDGSEEIEMTTINKNSTQQAEGMQRRQQASNSAGNSANASIDEPAPGTPDDHPRPTPTGQNTVSTDTSTHAIPIAVGIGVIAFASALLIAVLVTRSLLPGPTPRSLDLFANMYLAGTIIFGGGPVVIPLLRQYVVEPGWVASRDFLIGLAIIQSFPGPNFNFAVYLGALAVAGTGKPGILGAFLGFLGIFFPGLAFTIGVQGMWRVLRTKAVVVSVLRGINATAVGLVFTAVYRLWEIGYLTPEASNGQSLALEPWWVVVAALSYVETCWFRVPPAAAILFGGLLGLAWFGVTQS